MKDTGFAQRLREIRKKNGLSQRQLADMVHVSLSTIQNYERGVTVPTADRLSILSIALECEIGELAVGNLDDGRAQVKLPSTVAKTDSDDSFGTIEILQLFDNMERFRNPAEQVKVDTNSDLSKELLAAYRLIVKLQTEYSTTYDQLMLLAKAVKALRSALPEGLFDALKGLSQEEKEQVVKDILERKEQTKKENTALAEGTKMPKDEPTRNMVVKETQNFLKQLKKFEEQARQDLAELRSDDDEDDDLEDVPVLGDFRHIKADVTNKT